ncbi:MAG: DNA polymerase III subunit chi [Simplicispira sp.]|nr:DNA polymerase III subunit chi [Simplicispira sp.]
MTQVAFHFNAPDKLAYACRFARKMLRSENRLVITAEQPVLDQLDVLLWHMAPHEFVAHGHAGSTAHVLQLSPIILMADPRKAAHHEVLLNVGTAVPLGFEGFEHLIEVVSASDENDRQEARGRWRSYAQQGYPIVRHDLVLKG